MMRRIVFGGYLTVFALFLGSCVGDASYKICEPSKAGPEDCSTYQLVPYLLIRTFNFLNFYGAAVTALATIAIGFFTFTLWTSSRAQLKHSREVERAYLSSSGPLIVGQQNPFKAFKLEISNNGRTPGTLLKFCVEFRELSRIKEAPEYLDSAYNRITSYRRGFYPGERDVQLARPTIPVGLVDPIVYGRIWYSDIWGKKHSSGFLLKIEAGGTTGTIDAKDAHPEYTSWD